MVSDVLWAMVKPSWTVLTMNIGTESNNVRVISIGQIIKTTANAEAIGTIPVVSY